MGIFNLLRLVSPSAQFASFTVSGAAASRRDGDSGERPLCAEVHLVVGTAVTALRGTWDSSLITGRAGSTAMRRVSAVRGARKMAWVK